MTSGGAIQLSNPYNVDISWNNFTNNSVVENNRTNWEKSGGAIYYACDPNYDFGCEVSLTNNRFTRNRAYNKGGALRWVNKNFTSG